METATEFWPLPVAAALGLASLVALWVFRRTLRPGAGEAPAARMERALAAARRDVARRQGGRPRPLARARMQLVMLLVESGGRLADRGQLEEALEVLSQTAPTFQAEGLVPELASALYYRGRAEWGLGLMESGWTKLETAVATFRELLALTPWPRHLLRSVVVSLPAVILVDIGERRRDGGTVMEGLRMAHEAAALARRRIAVEYCIVQRNLSHALAVAGQERQDPGLLEEAVSVARQADAAIRRAQYPGQWLATQAALGHALSALGALRGDRATLAEAVAVLDEARPAADSEAGAQREGRWMLRLNGGAARLALGRLERDAAVLGDAVRELAATRDALEAANLPFPAAEAACLLGEALGLLAAAGGDPATMRDAAAHYRSAAAVFTTAGATARAVEAETALARLESGEPGGPPGRAQPLYIVR